VKEQMLWEVCLSQEKVNTDKNLARQQPSQSEDATVINRHVIQVKRESKGLLRPHVGGHK